MRTLVLINAACLVCSARQPRLAGLLRLLGCLCSRAGSRLAFQEFVEGRSQFDLYTSVLVDVDGAEECLVEDASGEWVGLDVGGVAVAGQVETLAQGGAGGVMVRGLGVKTTLDAAQLVRDAVLLGFHEVDRDGAGVVGVKQLLTLAGEFVALGGQVPARSRSSGIQLRELVENGVLDLIT